MENPKEISPCYEPKPVMVSFLRDKEFLTQTNFDGRTRMINESLTPAITTVQRDQIVPYLHDFSRHLIESFVARNVKTSVHPCINRSSTAGFKKPTREVGSSLCVKKNEEKSNKDSTDDTKESTHCRTNVQFDFSPIYEQYDFLGKMRRRLFRQQFRSSLAPLPELEIFYNAGQRLVTNLSKDRVLCEKVFANDIPFVTSLLSSGISPNCYDDHKRTPLHIAVSKSHYEMVQLLLHYGADPNIKDGLGNSCLHLTACTNNVDMALILIKGGASVDSVDVRGRSPIQLAQSKLRILKDSSDASVKSKISKVIEMLLLYLEKSKKSSEDSDETELLSGFQDRLRITESSEQISTEIDNLSKVLTEMESLSIK